MSQTEVSDEELLRLWRDPNFSGSYRGARTFQVLLKTDLGIDVPLRRLYQVFKSDPIFLIHQKPIRNFSRRQIDVHNYGELCQCDLAVLHPDPVTGERYFLLLVDVFSSKLFVETLKTKDGPTVTKALQKILKDFKSQIYVLQSDRGKEFLNKQTQQVLKSFKIVYRPKYGKNKCAIIEHYIYLIKKKLYMLLRGTLSNKWAEQIRNVVKSFNNTPIQRLGWLTPNAIKSEVDSVKVDEAKKKHHIEVYKEPTYEKQSENQSLYLANEKNLQPGDYVYKNFDEKLFDKSYDVSVRILSTCTSNDFSKFYFKNWQYRIISLTFSFCYLLFSNFTFKIGKRKSSLTYFLLLFFFSKKYNTKCSDHF